MRVEVYIEPVNGDVTAYVDGVLADEVVVRRTDEDEEDEEQTAFEAKEDRRLDRERGK
jgi:hypothetical protein